MTRGLVVVIVCGSVRGSPGVSCLTAGVAGFLQRGVAGSARGHGRGRSVLLVEADPAGGVIASRAGLGAHPGMASLAAQSRGGVLSAGVVAPHVQPLSSGVGVLVGPLAGDQAVTGLEVLGEALAQFAQTRPDSEVILVDAGRIDLDSEASPLLWAADGVVLLVWADTEGLAQAAAWLRTFADLAGRVAVVARQPISGTEYSPREIADGLRVQVLGRIPHDDTAATAFTTDPERSATTRRRAGRRGRWWRATEQIAERIGRLSPLVPNDPVVTSGNGNQAWGSPPASRGGS